MPALVIIAVVFGWATSLLVPILMHPTPARELDIVGTSWVVSRIHDAEIGAQDRARITFGIDRARVELGCGSITSRLVMDSDGAAMDVLGAADVVEACDGQLTSVERMQLEAIRDVFQWRIESPDRIVLEGGPAVTLDRVRVP